jgi:WD40 repeat protein
MHRTLSALLTARPVRRLNDALLLQPFAAEQVCMDVPAASVGRLVAVGSLASAAVVSERALLTQLLCQASAFGHPVALQWHALAGDSLLLMAQFGEREAGRVCMFRVVRDGEPLLEPSFTLRLRSTGSVWCSAWHPLRTDAFAAGGSGRAYFCVADGGAARVRELASDKSDVFCVAFDARGTIVHHGARDGNVRTVDLRAGPPAVASHLPLLHHGGSVSSIAVENSCELLVASHSGVVQRWDVRSCRAATETFVCPMHNPLTKLAVATTSDILNPQTAGVPLLAAGSSDGFVHLWSLKRGGGESRPLRSIAVGMNLPVTALKFDDTGSSSAALTSLWVQTRTTGVVKVQI